MYNTTCDTLNTKTKCSISFGIFQFGHYYVVIVEEKCEQEKVELYAGALAYFAGAGAAVGKLQ